MNINRYKTKPAGFASVAAAFKKGFENYNARGSRTAAVNIAKARTCGSCAAVKEKIREFNDAIDNAVARIREEWSIAGVFSWISIQLQKLRFNISLMSGGGGCGTCSGTLNYGGECGSNLTPYYCNDAADTVVCYCSNENCSNWIGATANNDPSSLCP